jgi:hypothetical protein
MEQVIDRGHLAGNLQFAVGRMLIDILMSHAQYLESVVEFCSTMESLWGPGRDKSSWRKTYMKFQSSFFA